MDKKYKLTLHIGNYTKTGVTSRFAMVAHLNGDAPYKSVNTMIYLLDEEIIERMGFDLVLDINGVFIPNDFENKGYTVEEAYHHAIETDVDLFLDALKDALTGEHKND